MRCSIAPCLLLAKMLAMDDFFKDRSLPPHLYMAFVMRPHFVEQHNFYVAQTKKRVLARFRDIEGDAHRYFEAEHKRFLKRRGDVNIDTDVLAKDAYDSARDHYWALVELRQQVILGVTAGLYHMWEKELRDFIARELALDLQQPELMKLAWLQPIDEIWNLFTRSGWAICLELFYPLIDACHLVVNVFKHGNGASLEKLKENFPYYLREPAGSLLTLNPNFQDHTLLTVSEDDFIQIAGALRSFWRVIPERLYVKF